MTEKKTTEQAAQTEQTEQTQQTAAKTSAELWQEVGQQLEMLGETIAAAVRSVIDDTVTSPEAQKWRAEVEKAAKSAREAGERTAEEMPEAARTHLITALQKASTGLQKLADRLEQHAQPEETEETEEAVE